MHGKVESKSSLRELRVFRDMWRPRNIPDLGDYGPRAAPQEGCARSQGLHLANSDGLIADDAGPFQVAHRGPEVLHGMCWVQRLSQMATEFVRSRHRTWIFGNAGLAEQVAQKLPSTRNHSWVTRWLSFESRTSLASSIISSLKYDSPSKKGGTSTGAVVLAEAHFDQCS
jgi:hypothetical protein